MLQKDEQAKESMSSAIKRLIFGILLMGILISVVPGIIGVDPFQLCTVDKETGECTSADNVFLAGDFKVLMFGIVEAVVIIVGLIIIIAPLITIGKAQLTTHHNCPHVSDNDVET